MWICLPKWKFGGDNFPWFLVEPNKFCQPSVDGPLWQNVLYHIFNHSTIIVFVMLHLLAQVLPDCVNTAFLIIVIIVCFCRSLSSTLVISKIGTWLFNTIEVQYCTACHPGCSVWWFCQRFSVCTLKLCGLLAHYIWSQSITNRRPQGNACCKLLCEYVTYDLLLNLDWGWK